MNLIIDQLKSVKNGLLVLIQQIKALSDLNIIGLDRKAICINMLFKGSAKICEPFLSGYRN